MNAPAGLFALVIPTLLLTVLGPPASAVEEVQVSALIESVTPAIPTGKDDLRISGRVANTGTGDVVLPRVQLLLVPSQLSSRTEVTAVMAGVGDAATVPVSGSLVELGDSLAAGQQAKFDITVPVADLGLPTDLAGVHAGYVQVLSGDVPLSQSGTVFPWFPPDAEIRPTRLAWLWPITQRPAVAGDDLVVDPALPGEFTGGGRLGRLLALGRRYDVAWLIDAATWQTARELSDGYRVVSGEGPRPGDQTDAAAQFAAALEEVLVDGPSAAPQYGHLDSDAMQREGLDRFVTRAGALPRLFADRASADPMEVFDAPSGNSDSATLQTVVDGGVRDLLLADRVFPPDPPVPYTPSGVTPLTVGSTQVTGLLTDRILDRVLQRPLTSAAERSRAKQEFLAQTALITLELPVEPRSVVVAPPSLWDPPAAWLNRLMRATSSAPWVRLTDLTEVARATPAPRLDTGYGEAARRRELPRDYVQRIGDLDVELTRLADIVVDPAGYGESLSLALMRAGSALWRDDPDGRTVFLDTVAAQIQEQKRKVRVVSSGTVTLAGDSGSLPLTIANDLDRPVEVGVRLATDNPITLQYSAPEPLRIEAQEKAGIEIPVKVIGSQPNEVSIVLTDAAGRTYDDTATIELRSTASSRIAVVVTAVGGVALVILVALNLFRRRRQRTPGTEEPVDTHV